MQSAGHAGSFSSRHGGSDYRQDVPVNAATAGDFPYTVAVSGVGIEAEGGSGPRIIITP